MIDKNNIYYNRFNFIKNKNKNNIKKIKSKIEIIDSKKHRATIEIKNTEKDLIRLINNYVKK